MFGSTYIQHTYKKFARFHKAQRDNMCKVDNQALFYVKVLSETHLYHEMFYKYLQYM